MPEAVDANELRKYPQIRRGFRCRARIAGQRLKIPERQANCGGDDANAARAAATPLSQRLPN